MTGNNRKLDLVNINSHTKFGQILAIISQDIEQFGLILSIEFSRYLEETKIWHKSRAITLLKISKNDR